MSNTFRHEYRELTEEEQIFLDNIKIQAATMEAFIDMVPEGRERSLAMTKLEEAVMWAVKGITG